MYERDIIDLLRSKGINLISGARAYVFEVGFRGEYDHATPEILFNEDELRRMSQLGKIVGISYHQKERVIRVTVRRRDAI
jgi:hypothetical protein